MYAVAVCSKVMFYWFMLTCYYLTEENRKIPTLGPIVHWVARLAEFLTGMMDPRIGTFLSPLNTNNGFYLSNKCGVALH